MLDVPPTQSQPFLALYFDVLTIETFLLGMPIPHNILAVVPTSHIYFQISSTGIYHEPLVDFTQYQHSDSEDSSCARKIGVLEGDLLEGVENLG